MWPGDARGSASQGGQHRRRTRQGPTAPSGSRGDARIEAREGDARSGAGDVCPRAGTRSSHRRRPVADLGFLSRVFPKKNSPFKYSSSSSQQHR